MPFSAVAVGSGPGPPRGLWGDAASDSPSGEALQGRGQQLGGSGPCWGSHGAGGASLLRSLQRFGAAPRQEPTRGLALQRRQGRCPLPPCPSRRGDAGSCRPNPAAPFALARLPPVGRRSPGTRDPVGTGMEAPSTAGFCLACSYGSRSRHGLRCQAPGPRGTAGPLHSRAGASTAGERAPPLAWLSSCSWASELLGIGCCTGRLPAPGRGKPCSVDWGSAAGSGSGSPPCLSFPASGMGMAPGLGRALGKAGGCSREGRARCLCVHRPVNEMRRAWQATGAPV